MADLLDGPVIASVPLDLAHRVRVAAHLCRLVGRELDLADTLDADERVRLEALGFAGDLQSARAALHRRLADPEPIDDAEDDAVFDALLQTIRGDLAIDKPGYDR